MYKRKRSGALKARLCVQGCAQTAGVDYDQTFCATMRPSSLRALASIAAGNGILMRRWDFVAAYLQGELQDGEVVYCHASPGYATFGADGRLVYAASRNPYTAWRKQAAAGSVRSFRGCCNTASLNSPRTHASLRCYVDDLFILYSDPGPDSLCARFTEALTTRWNVEDEGPVSDTLNVEITCDDTNVILSQGNYIPSLVDTYMPDGMPARFQRSDAPASEDLPKLVEAAIAAKMGEPAPAPLLRSYQSLVGAILYCSTQTRPDVAYAVGMLCRAMGCPAPARLDAAHRVLAYLHHHRDVGLRYESCPEP
eukprot:6199295-Pleurochrysis_carterae.AAC.3